jgi:hypothetical protein
MIHHIGSLAEGGQLYVLSSLGRLVRVTAIVTSVEEANAFCERYKGQSVIAEVGTVVLLARRGDDGEIISSRAVGNLRDHSAFCPHCGAGPAGEDGELPHYRDCQEA